MTWQGRRGLQRGVLQQDLPLETTQLTRGFDAELVHQQAARLPIHLQGFGLAAGSVEGQHVQAAQAFARRVGGDQLLQPGQDLDMPSELQCRGDPELEGFELEPLKAADLPDAKSW